MKRIWNVRQISIASFLAGPIGGCYLLSQNNKIFGRKTQSRINLIVGILATFGLIVVSLFLPSIQEGVWLMLVPLFYTLLISGIAEFSQKKLINELLNSGIKRHSYFKLILVSSILVLLTFIFSYGFCYGLDILTF